MESGSNIRDLILKHVEGHISEQESYELLLWTNEHPSNKEFFNSLLSIEEASERAFELHQAEASIWVKIVNAAPEFQTKRILRFNRFAVAASIVVLILVGGQFYSHRYLASREMPNQVAKDLDQSTSSKEEGTLVLANGQAIPLNEEKHGQIANQGNTRISKQSNGRIVYTTEGNRPDTIFQNVLRTRKEPRSELMLANGTLVVLSAFSQLWYPTAFSNANWKLHLSGRADLVLPESGRTRPTVKIGSATAWSQILVKPNIPPCVAIVKIVHKKGRGFTVSGQNITILYENGYIRFASKKGCQTSFLIEYE
jgi:hypothetical protein